jgi:hypothetical protein
MKKRMLTRLVSVAMTEEMYQEIMGEARERNVRLSTRIRELLAKGLEREEDNENEFIMD